MASSPIDWLSTKELTRRELLRRVGVSGAAIALPGILIKDAAASSIACYATGESCFLGIDPDIYHMPLTGEYIQTRSGRICATANWSQSQFPPEAFDFDFIRASWSSLPASQQRAVEAAAFGIGTTHWGPPDAPPSDLTGVRVPADFAGEVFASLVARALRVEFEVPKTDFQRLGWTPELLPGASIPPDPAPEAPVRLRGWYIKGDGITDGGSVESPLIIMSSAFPYTVAYDRLVGSMDVGRQMRKTVTYFVAQGFDVLFFDKRGHGYSEGVFEAIGEDIFRALDLLEHGVVVEDGVSMTLSIITPDGRLLSGPAAASEQLLGPGYTAKSKPVVLRGFSYGSSHAQRAMAMNYSDLPVEYRFIRDASGEVVVDTARSPRGNRGYNFRGIIAISGFQGSLKYETTPYFLALEALASRIGHNGAVMKSSVYDSMDKWPAHLGLYATNDYETADGAIDAFNDRLRGLKEIEMVTGYHFGLGSEAVDTYFAELSARFARTATLEPMPSNNPQTTTYAREVCRAETVVMDPGTESITDVPSKAITDSNRRVDHFIANWIARPHA
jgi:pimeloyl-ACP methyl ester carboxylesterase